MKSKITMKSVLKRINKLPIGSLGKEGLFYAEEYNIMSQLKTKDWLIMN
jgi:hypothetical protein